MRNLRITPPAERAYEDILDFAASHYGSSTERKTFERIDAVLATLRQSPDIGVRVPGRPSHFRSYLIRPWLRVFYRYTETKLVILNFHDTRQQPPDDL